MNALEKWKRRGLRNLDEFVEAANALLPQFLPEETGDLRVRDEVNARLVRHLASSDLISPSLREGREARYDYLHLLQLLAARRLLAEGYATDAIRKLLRGADENRLEQLLQGETHVGVGFKTHSSEYSRNAALNASDGGAARDFLQRVKARRGSPSPAPSTARASTRASPAPSTPSALPDSLQASPLSQPTAAWKRIEVRRGLEVHVSDEFLPPTTPHERATLLSEIERAIKEVEPKSSRRKR